MKNKYKLFGLYLPLFLAAVISTVVMRTVALFNDFDVKTGFFIDKTLITVADVMVVAFSVVFLTYILTARRDFKMIPDFTSPLTYPPTGIVAAALVFVGINFFKKANASLDKISYLKDSIYASERAELGTERILLILAIVIALLALASVAHFALSALIEKGTSFTRGDFGIVTVAFLAIYSIYLYFDNDLPINSPAKILDQMAYLFAAVFFLYETRLSIGREKWRGYIAFGFIAALISAYSSIPSLIYFFAKDTEISVSIYEMILSSALFIFITSRMLLTSELIEDVASPFAKIIAEASDQRTADITPAVKEEEISETEDEAIDENQLTIDDVCDSEATENAADNTAETSDASIPADEADVSEPAVSEDADNAQLTLSTDAQNATYTEDEKESLAESDAEDKESGAAVDEAKNEDASESSEKDGKADAEIADTEGKKDSSTESDAKDAEIGATVNEAKNEDASESFEEDGKADADGSAEDSNVDSKVKKNVEKKQRKKSSSDK